MDSFKRIANSPCVVSVLRSLAHPNAFDLTSRLHGIGHHSS
jgi:hypothetical protein